MMIPLIELSNRYEVADVILEFFVCWILVIRAKHMPC